MNGFLSRKWPLVFAAILSGTSAYGNTYVNDRSDFQNHILHHKERVVKLGLYLASDSFPELKESTVEDFLRQHDLSKTHLDSLTFEKFGFQKLNPPYFDLYEFYGLVNKTEDQTQLMKKVIDQINSIDKQVSLEFFSKHPELNDKDIEKLYKIEKVADLVDRSFDPVAAEEFGRSMTPASQFLKDQELIKYATLLESKYKLITENMETPVAKSCRRAFSLF